MKSSGQPSLLKLCLLALMFVSYTDTYVLSAPKGAHVVSGTATFQQDGNLTVINASDRAIINYQSFNIAPNQTVQFIQPSSNASVLNRVTSPNPTNIFGQLTSNGNVYIVNPYGVFFQNGAVLNVGGLYAGAGKLSDADFTKGRIHFTDLTGDVRNDGVLAADNRIALMGANVVNTGSVTSARGMAMMVSGRDVYVGERNGNIFVQANGAPATAATGPAGSVTNSGKVAAPRVVLGAGDLYSTAIVNSGLLQGRSIQVNAGAGGTATVGGRLDATSANNRTSNGKGGNIQVLGGQVALRGATIDASGANGGGAVRVGGDFHGGSTLLRSQTTTVDAATTIRADATGAAGNGGSVVVWSDAATGYVGQISARGGSVSGNGGSAEVSSGNQLGYNGLVDLRAPGGASGSLLLDPHTIKIVAAGGADPVPTPVNFGDTPDDGVTPSDKPDYTINAGALGRELGLASVTLEANTDIHFFASVTGDALKVAGVGGDLTLRAGRSILFDAGVTLTLVGSLTAVFNDGGTKFADGGATVTSRDAGAAVFSMAAATTGNNAQPAAAIIAPKGVTITGDTLAGNATNATGQLDANTGAVTLQNITTNGTPISVTNNAASTATGHDITSAGTLVTTPTANNTAGGDITLNTKGLLSISVLTATGKGAGAGGAISLTSGSGTTFNGAVNGGSLGVTGAGTFAAGGSVTTTGTGTQNYYGALTLNQPVTTLTGGGTITFSGKVDGTTAGINSLVVNTPGDEVFSQPIGSSVKLGNLTTDATGAATGAVHFNMSLTDSASATNKAGVNLGGSLLVKDGVVFDIAGTPTAAIPSISTTGTQTYSGTATLQADTRLLSTLAVTTPSTADITLTGAVDGAFKLELDALDAITISAAVGSGTGTALTSFATTNTATLNLNGGSIKTTGAAGQSFGGPVALGASGTTPLTTLTAGTGPIVFNSTVDGSGTTAQSLNLNNTGGGTFAGAVGGDSTRPIGSLTAGSTAGMGTLTISGGSVTTTGGQTYNANVKLSATGTTPTTTFTDTGSSEIVFGKLDGDADGTQSVVINTKGNETFTGQIGSAFRLLDLTTDSVAANRGGQVNLNSGGINTAGVQTYNDQLHLGKDTAITASDLVLTSGYVDGTGATGTGSTAGPNSLTLVLTSRATTSPLTLTGGVGGATATGTFRNINNFSLSVTGSDGNPLATTVATDFETYGSQTFVTPLTLGGDVRFLSFNGGNIQFGTVDSDSTPRSLTVLPTGGTTSGNTIFTGQVGAASPLASVQTGSPTSTAGKTQFDYTGTGATVTTINHGTSAGGKQDYYQAAQLLDDTTLVSQTDASVPTTVGGPLTFHNSVDGGFDLTLTTNGGNVTFNGPVGDNNALDKLTVSNSTTATFFSTAVGTKTGAGVNLGEGGLDLKGAVTFTITGISLTGSANPSVVSMGGQTYEGTVTLGHDTMLRATDATSAIDFKQTVSGAFGLAVNVNTQGTITFERLVNSLTSLTTGAAYTDPTGTVYFGTATTNSGVTTSNSNNDFQNYNSAVVLQQNTKFIGGGAITFAGTVNGAHGLTVNTPGVTTFEGVVGGTAALTSLTTDNGNGTGEQTVFMMDASTAAAGKAGVNVAGDLTIGDAAVLAVTNSSYANGHPSILTTGTGKQTYQLGLTEQQNTVLEGVSLKLGSGGTINGGGFDLTLDFSDVIDVPGYVSQAPDSLVRNFASLGSKGVNLTESFATSGSQTYNGPVRLLNPGIVLTPGANSSVTFNGTLDGSTNLNEDLTIKTGGDVYFNGVVGGKTPLLALTVQGVTAVDATNGTTHFAMTLGSGNVAGVNVGALAVYGKTDFSVQGLGTDGTKYSVQSAYGQYYDKAMTLGADTALDGAGQIQLHGTVTGQHNLTVISSLSNIEFDGQVGAGGNSNALLSLTTSTPNNGTATIFNVSGGTENNPTVTTINLDGTSGAQTYNNAVALEQDTVLVSNFLTPATTGGAINFKGTVDSYATSPHGLTVIAGVGQTTFGPSVHTINAAQLILGGANVTFSGDIGKGSALTLLKVGNKGTLANTTPTVQLGMSLTTTAGQTYTDNVVLTANLTLKDTLGNDITFQKAVDGQFNLTVSTAGNEEFDGQVGGVTPLLSLTTDAGITPGGATIFHYTGTGAAVTTVNTGAAGFGGQTYHDTVTLMSDTTLASTFAAPATAGGDIQFLGTVGGTFRLTVNTSGNTVFAQEVGGGTSPLRQLTTDAGGATYLNGGSVTTNSSGGTDTYGQFYHDHVYLGVNTTLTDKSVISANLIEFGGKVDTAAVVPAATLTINANRVSFDDAVGADSMLLSLTSTAPTSTTLAGNVSTGTFQSYGATTIAAPVTLQAGTNVTFNSTLGGVAPSTTDTSLTINAGGTVLFAGLAATSTPLTSLTVSGSAIEINGGGVTTAGAQTYNNAVSLGKDAVLTSTGAGDVTFNSTVDGAFALTVNTAGQTVFGGPVGSGTNTALTSLTTDKAGTTVINGGGITTTGAQTYNDAVTLGADTVLASTSKGDITLGGKVDGAFALTINTAGNTVFGGLVGSGTNTALASVTTDAAGTTAINGGGITTTGAQTYNDAVTLGADTVLASTATGNITLGGKVDGAFALTVNTAGQTIFGGLVGSGANTALASLTTDKAGTTAINGGGVRTTGAQTYNDAVTLGADAILSSTGAGDITFADKVDGTFALTVNTAGQTIFNGLVGSGTNTPLASLTTDAGGTTQLNGGGVRTIGAQSYGDAVTLGADTVLTSTLAGNITLGGKVDGAFALTVNTAGQTIFNGLVGSGTALTSLTTDGTGAVGEKTQFNIAVGNATAGVLVNGPVTIGDAVVFNITGGSLAQPSVLTLANGSQNYNRAASIASDTYLVSATALPAAGGTFAGGGSVSFGAGVSSSGGNNLYVRAGAGTTTFASTVNVGSIDLGGTQVSFGGPVTLPGLLSVEPNGGGTAGTIALNGGALTTNGAQVYNAAVILGGDVVLTSLNTAGDGGNIVFNSTVNGTFALTVNTPGQTIFNGLVGNATPLASLTTDAAGTTQLNGGGVRTVGAQNYGDAVTLGADTLLTSTGAGNIAFGGTLDGAFALTVNTAGQTIFGGQVGSTTRLVSVTTDNAGTTAINGGGVRTTGAQNYGDAVTLGADTILSSNNAGSITFGKTLDGTFALTVNTAGNTVFAGTVGGAAPLLRITTDAPGATVLSGGTITTLAAQTYADRVTLGANTVLNSVSNGDITFGSSLDGSFALMVNTGGNTVFTGAVGTNSALASVSTDSAGATFINGGSIRTSGAQTYRDAVLLGADTTLTSTGAGAVDFVTTLDGGHALTVNTAGQTIFGSYVGSSSPLASLTTDDAGTTAINGQTVTTFGAQTYNDAVTLGALAILQSRSGGAITFRSTVDGGFALTVNTSGQTIFNGLVGGGTALASVTTDAGGTTAINGGGVRTTGAQSYGDAVSLGANTVLTSTGAGNVNFASTLDGGFALVINTAGQTIFGGRVGGGTALASVTTDAPGATQLNGGAVNTTGAQTYGDAVTLGANTVLASTGAGNVSFGSTLDGGFALTVNTAGQTVFGGQVGANAALASVTTDADGATAINGGGVRTTGAQNYNDAASLGADTTLASTNAGNVNFASTLDGGFALTVNTAGQTIFGGLVGGGRRLASVTTDAPGATLLNGGGVRTVGAQTYNDAVGLGAGTVLDSSESGNIVFGATLNGAFALTVNTAGNTVFTGLVGGSAPLASVTTDAAGATAINGGGVRTTGAQSYNDAVRLGANALLASSNGGNVAFGATLDGGFALTVNTAGQTVFGGQVGGSAPLASVTTDAPGSTVFNGGGVNTTGFQNYQDAATLGANALLASSNGGNVAFGATLDGGFALTVNTAGQTVFGGQVGGSAPLASVTTDAPGSTVFNGGGVNTTGFQNYQDAVRLGAGTTLASADTADDGGSITLGSTVDGAFNLTVNTPGDENFNGLVGATTPLSGLTTDAAGTVGGTARFGMNVGAATAGVHVTGGVTINDAATLAATGSTAGRPTVLSGGAQLYQGAATLGADTVLQAGGDVTFSRTLDGNFALAVNTAGQTIFGGLVGGGMPLASVTTDAGGTTVFFGGVNTVGAQTYGDAALLKTNSTLASNGGGDIVFDSTVDGTFALTVSTSGQTVFNDNVGGSAALASLKTDAGGTTVFAAPAGRSSLTVTTNGVQIYGDSVRLRGDVTLDGGNDVRFNDTVDGAHNLVVSAGQDIVFRGVVGGAAMLRSLTVTRGRNVLFDGNANSISTSGLQSYGAAVLVNAPVTLASTAGNITFSKTVDGPSSLALATAADSTTTFAKAVGGTTPLLSLTTGGGRAVFSGGGVHTTDFQTYNGPVRLDNDSSTFRADGGDITFQHTIDGTTDGANALTLDTSGTTVINGAVGGGSVRLASVTTTGDLAFNGDTLTTVGAQTYGGNVAADPTDGGQTRMVSAKGTIDYREAVSAGGGGFYTEANRVVSRGDMTSVGNLDLESRTVDGGYRPLVLLGGKNYVSTGGSVFFSTAGLSTPATNDPLGSAVATVILTNTGTTVIQGKDFTMGYLQKIFSLGSVNINVSGGVATLGDIAARESLKVSASQVDLLARPPGPTIPGRDDSGLNFAAGRSIDFGRARIVFVGNENLVADFTTSTGDTIVQRIQGVSLFKDPTLDNDFRPYNGFGVNDFLAEGNVGQPPFTELPFEPVSGGSQTLDTAAALSGALPDQKPLDVASDITITASQIEELKKLGIHPRHAQKSERGSINSKRALFAQLVDGGDAENYGRLQPIKGGISRLEPSDFVVVVDRMSEREVQSILQSFEGVYGKNKEKAPEIGAAFQTAFNDYTVEKQTADPAGFGPYLQGKPGKYPAVESAVRSFDDLFGHIEHLGLTSKEVLISEEHIASDLGVSGVSPTDMVKVINDLRKKLPAGQKAPSTKLPPSAPVGNPAPGATTPAGTPAPAATPAPPKKGTPPPPTTVRRQKKDAPQKTARGSRDSQETRQADLALR